MKKKISELSPEEQERVRKYNREQKQKSREKQRVAAYVPSADEAADSFPIDFPDRVVKLNDYAKQCADKVAQELGRELVSPRRDLAGHIVGYDRDEEFTVERVAKCLLSLRQSWIQTAQDGELVAGSYFTDSSGFMVEAANRYGLKQSQTFKEIYTELLTLLDRRYGRQQTEDAAIVKAELAGRYALPPPPEPDAPKPETEKIHEASSVPTDREILERGQTQLSTQLSVQDPNLS